MSENDYAFNFIYDICLLQEVMGFVVVTGINGFYSCNTTKYKPIIKFMTNINVPINNIQWNTGNRPVYGQTPA